MPYSAAQKRQYYAIKNALTGAEKALIGFYEIQWMLNKRVPTVSEVVTYLKKKSPKTNEISVNYYLARKPVIEALDNRGIPWRQHSQSELTPTQVAAAVTMMNFTDVRANSDKLAQLGIQPATYYAWLNDPQFKNLCDSLADQNLANIRPTAITELTKLVNKGDFNAIKYFLDTTGGLLSEAPQSEQLIVFIIEIIQKHVKDENVMAAIAADILAASGNRTLEVIQPLEITGELVEDVSLEDAKKKLGIG